MKVGTHQVNKSGDLHAIVECQAGYAQKDSAGNPQRRRVMRTVDGGCRLYVLVGGQWVDGSLQDDERLAPLLDD